MLQELFVSILLLAMVITITGYGIYSLMTAAYGPFEAGFIGLIIGMFARK